MEEKSNPNFILKKWLDKLQEDSWNLELLISGFSIFGLFKASDFVQEKWLWATANDVETMSLWFYFQTSLSILNIAIFIFIFFLLVHIIFRGLWIGAIGIRYVSGEIEYDQLKYNRYFTNYLKRKVGSFDNYIFRLEKISSLIFGFTFLLIFSIFSAYLYLIFVIILMNSLNKITTDTSFRWVNTVVFFLLTFMGLLVAFDFFSAGLLKKIKGKWFAKFYMPINKFISMITLSFLWRPLYYNMVDDKKTKILIYLILPLIALLTFISSLQYNPYSIFPSKYTIDGISKFDSYSMKGIANYSINSQYYDDLRDNESKLIEVLSLPSKDVKSDVMEVFVKMYLYDQATMQKLDSTIIPITVEGVNSVFGKKSTMEQDIKDAIDEQKNQKTESKKDNYLSESKTILQEQNVYNENLKKILKTAKSIYQFKINDIPITSDSIGFLFEKHNSHGEDGFIASFPLNNIKKGLNFITLSKAIYQNPVDEIVMKDFTIPFYFKPE